MQPLRIGIATNACTGDELRLRHSIPNWMRVFGNRLTDLLIVIDTEPASGRIAALQAQPGNQDSLMAEADRLSAASRSVRRTVLPSRRQLRSLGTTWFGRPSPMRCQAGTPILAFAYAIEASWSAFVLRVDCDTIFSSSAWVEEAVHVLQTGEADLVEPSRTAEAVAAPAGQVSSRALLVHRPSLARKLPIAPARLDVMRRVHRFITRRSSWLAFEQMLAAAAAAQVLRHVILPSHLGYRLHVPYRTDFSNPTIRSVIQAVETGRTPARQRERENLEWEAWSKELSS